MDLIIDRDAWGAEAPKSVTLVDPEDRDAFVVHYSTGEELGRDDVPAWVRAIQAFHQDDRGWADIAYNFLIDKDGHVYEGRGWDRQGAHADGWNTRGIGVCFLGDDDPGRDVPKAARLAFRLLYEAAQARYGDLSILGHRDVNPDTECPGGELERFVESRLTLGIEDVQKPRPTRPVKSRPAPGPTGLGAPRFPLDAGRFFGVKGKAGTSSGEHLKAWQAQMRRRGWRIVADGIFGPETLRVVEAFQREKGLKVDGKIGPRTWAAAWTALIT